jgi:hypothetical protein
MSETPFQRSQRTGKFSGAESAPVATATDPEVLRNLPFEDPRHPIHSEANGQPRPSGPRPLPLSTGQAVLQDHYPAAKQMPQPKRKQQGA